MKSKILVFTLLTVLLVTTISPSLSFAAASKFNDNVAISSEFPLGQIPKLTGTISSQYKIKSVDISINSTEKKVIFGTCLYPNKKTYNVDEILKLYSFDSLKAGKYLLLINIVDEKKKTYSVAKEFKVATYESKFSDESISIASKTGYQTQFKKGSYEMSACATFALAYADSIISGKQKKYKDYWSNDSKDPYLCVWSKGNFTVVKGNSAADIVDRAYLEYLNGKPSVIHVMGKIEHWVTVVGVTNVVDLSKISSDNLLIMDPLYGDVVKLTDRYTIHEILRIAVHND